VAAACVFIKRSRGGWIFTGHKPNTTVRVELATAHGAPVFSERETAIEDGRAIEGFEKSFHHEARAFVRMDDGIVGMKELPAPPGKRRHFCLIDLAGADVTIFAEPGAVRRGELTLAREIAGARLPHHPGPEEDAACVRGYTGNLYVSW
jgi:hypothetical protein